MDATTEEYRTQWKHHFLDHMKSKLQVSIKRLPTLSIFNIY